MAHELAFVKGKASIAYVGEKPWHGLGQELTENASLDVWRTESGMDWEIKSSPVEYKIDGMEESVDYPAKRILYRSDTGAPLSIVSKDYKEVHPGEVLDFFKDLVELQGMKLSTAGVLFGGRRFWALADTNHACDVLGNDRVKGMLLLTTSCDGSIATTAQFTSVRVVCNNTLALSLNTTGNRTSISHRSVFNPLALKDKLGLIDKQWESFRQTINDMTKIKMSDKDTANFVFDLIVPDAQPEATKTMEKEVSAILNTIRNGMGTNKAYGTLWGVLNGITEHVDHKGRGRSADTKLWNTWYGIGAKVKEEAFTKALELV